MVHRPFKQLIVKSGDTLDLGNGHVLEFVSAPNLHWPDTIFTFNTGHYGRSVSFIELDILL